MENDFTYYAFISYSHKDAKWAEWIQHAIEHYKLPTIIRKEAQKPLPKRIAPVFRDVTDLGVDVLVDGLHEELEKSRFLIVVCSPNSAAPNAEGKHFVDEEVRHFCELGREKQIIPVIIEGTPQESFGPVLKSKEILALDATKQSKARILNDIIAKILGLKPDVLWRRERRRVVKLRIALGSLLSVGMIIVTMFSFCMWDYKRDVYKYYTRVEQRFGIPCGIVEVSEVDAINSGHYSRFHYQGYDFPPFLGGTRILRHYMEVSNIGVGGRHEEQYYYSDNGNLAKVTSLDGGGMVKEQRLYSDGNTNSCEVIVYENGSPKLGGGERMYIDFDEHSGKLAHVRYRHFDGKYEVLSYRDGGQEELREFFNADGTRGCDLYGTPIKLHLKPKDSRLVGMFGESGQLYFDVNTNRFVDAQGTSGFMYKLDEVNRIVEIINIEAVAKPSLMAV